MKKYLTEIYVKHNTKGKTYEMLAADMERDNFMTPEQSVEYGLADKVVTSREENSNKQLDNVNEKKTQSTQTKKRKHHVRS